MVTTVTEEMALRLLGESRLHCRVNVNVARSGSEFGEMTRLEVVWISSKLRSTSRVDPWLADC